MPEYLAPGVFVEETSFRHSSIEGVGTSVAAVVGPTRSGPVRGKPEVCTSFAEFSRIYGDAADLALTAADGSEVSQLNHTAIAARAFFDNGGKQLFVSRVVGGVNAADADNDNSSALRASTGAGSSVLVFNARFPGAMGNATLELRWRDGENLLKREVIGELGDGQTALIKVTELPKAAITDLAGTAPADDAFPLQSLTALVTRSDSGYAFVSDAKVEVVDKSGAASSLALSDLGSGLDGAALPASTKLTRVYARQPSSGKLGGADGSATNHAVLTLAGETDLSAYHGADHWGTLTTLRGRLDNNGTTFTVTSANNSGVSSNITLPLAALAARPGMAAGINVQRNFDLDVIQGGEVAYTFTDLALDPAADDGLGTRMPATPERRLDALTQPIACVVSAGATTNSVYTALYALFDDQALTRAANSLSEAKYLIKLSGGSDGELPGATDYAGEVDENLGSTGLAALEDIEDISIVMTPAAAADAANHQAVVAELQKHCNRMRYRVGLVDSREGMALSEVREFRDRFDDSRLALYHPWVVIADPTGQRRTVTVPPSGFMAGIYANTDVTRGVHKAPANEPVLGALNFAQEINRFQQELLNPHGINCLRFFPGRGYRVWGGRTLSSDPEWKYVNVRRYFLYLERSIERSTQWVVFEPNGEALWSNVRSTIDDFLYNEWASGHLLGGSPEEAYFVRCDRSTMTQNDLDNGRLICLVGVAPLKPAEFVIFRIGQKTADAQ